MTSVFDATMNHPFVAGLIDNYRLNFTKGMGLPANPELVRTLTLWCEECVQFALAQNYPPFEDPESNRQQYLDQTAALLFDNGINGMISTRLSTFRHQYPENARHPRTHYMIVKLAQFSTTIAQLLMVGLEPQKNSSVLEMKMN